jgi:4-hydroxybenzoate polyprenyltransferase
MYAKVANLLELMRFGRSIVTALIVLPITWSLSHYVIFVCFLLFSFAFNDWVDAEMDRDGHPNRPIPSGRVGASEAAVVSFALGASGVYFSINYFPELIKLFAYACVTSMVYSWIVKRHLPLVATPIWTLCVTFMVLTPATVSTVSWMLFFVVLYTHEVLLDMRDEKSDRIHCTTPSIATLLGQNCWWIVFSLLIIAVMLQKFGNTPILLQLAIEDPARLMQQLFQHMVVVVGAGIAGAVTFWRIQRRGSTLLEAVIAYYKSLFILVLQLI